MATHNRSAGITAAGLVLALVSLVSLACTSEDATPLPISGGGTEYSAGGEPVSGYPSWQERIMLVLGNALRMAPVGYRDAYTGQSTILASYTPQPPLAWRLELNQAARFHAEDMVNNSCFQHDDCDNSRTYSQRVQAFYPAAIAPLEIQSNGPAAPVQVMEFLICEGNPSSCPADFTSDFHRQLMMGYAGGYLPEREAGAGFAGTQMWVVDYTNNPPGFLAPIVGGSHFDNGSQLYFLVNFHDPAGASQGMQLILDGVSEPMPLTSGSAASGTYEVLKPLPSGCQSYHFRATDSAGDFWRYPGTGELRTFGTGSCTESFQP